MLTNFDKASNLPAGPERDRLLTFVVVGGGFAGIEVFAELRIARERRSCKYYPQLTFDDTHFHLIEAMGRIMPEVSLKTSHWVLKNLAQRGAEVHLDTQLTVAPSTATIELSTGETFESDLIIWTAGVMANPTVVRNTDLPIEERGRLRVRADLRVGTDDERRRGRLGRRRRLRRSRPHRRRRRRLLRAERPARRAPGQAAREEPRRACCAAKLPREYFHKNLGAVAGLGLGNGVFQSGKHRAQGPHRLVHAPRLPRSGDADVGAQDPRVRRLDPQLLPAPRHRLARGQAGSARHTSRSSPPARSPEVLSEPFC